MTPWFQAGKWVDSGGIHGGGSKRRAIGWERNVVALALNMLSFSLSFKNNLFLHTADLA